MSLLSRFVTPLGVIMLVVVGFILWLFIELPVLEGSIAHPEVVALDETFTFVVTASNPSEKKITLDSIDIQSTFLEGFRVVSVEPKPKDTLSVFGLRSWEFGTRVEPGEQVDVTFTLKAVAEGHFSGDLDICNPNQDYYTLIADVVVRNEATEIQVDETE